MAHVKATWWGGTPYVECQMCHYKGKGKRYCAGSTIIELILWLCLILPGLVYSLRRGGTRGYICPKCGNHNVIAITKKQAQEVEQKVEQAVGDKFDKLKMLVELKEKGGLTEEEFLAEKQKIMGL